MGRYGFYIVGAYAISALVICVMIADTLLRAGRWRAEVKRREAERDTSRGGESQA